MVTYGIIFILTGISLLVFSILLIRGNINLLHDYHKENVKKEDEKKLGKACGLSLLLGSLGTITSGVLSIIFREDIRFIFLFLIFVVPFTISVVLMLFFIKKYNGKIIS